MSSGAFHISRRVASGTTSRSSSQHPDPRDPSRRARRGTISILAAITALILVGLVGLGLDTALVQTARQQLQRTADAAALAAAAKVKIAGQRNYDQTRRAAIDSALSNTVLECGTGGIALTDNPTNDPSGEIVVGRWRLDTTLHRFVFQPTDFTTGLPRADAVQVTARCASGSLNSALDLVFGPIFGTNDSNVARTSIAHQGRPDEPLILILDRHRAGALLLDGGAHMDVLAGTIQVDSDDSCAFRTNGDSGLMEAQRTRVVGGACLSPSNLTGDLLTGAPYVADPLASLPEPSTAGMTNYGGITVTDQTYGPGYYPDGIDINNGTVTLQSGIYFIGKNAPANGINLGGNAFLVGTGVVLFLEAGAEVKVDGSGAGMQLSPLLSGTYHGVTIFQARASNQGSSIGGGGVFDIRGIYYIPNGEMEMHGDVTRRIGRIIVNTQRISGNAEYVITGEDLPPSTSSQSVFLVK